MASELILKMEICLTDCGTLQNLCVSAHLSTYLHPYTYDYCCTLGIVKLMMTKYNKYWKLR